MQKQLILFLLAVFVFMFFCTTTTDVELFPPTADAGKPRTANLSDTIRLSGKGTDSDGYIIKYEWKFGHSNWIETSTGDTLITVPSTAQEYKCSFRVTDNDGQTSNDYMTIHVGIDVVIDIDENVYYTVKIGNQTWTVQNLKTTKYNDGTDISYLSGDIAWENNVSGAYCFYNNNGEYKIKYGALYNWYAVNTGKLAPQGWHVATIDEFTILEHFLIANGYNWDGTTEGDKVAKSLSAKTDWNGSVEGGTPGHDMQSNNSTGFTALPGGYRYNGGGYNGLGGFAMWWSSTISGPRAYMKDIVWESEYFSGIVCYFNFGFYVRLVKD